MSEKVKYGTTQVRTLSSGVRRQLHSIFDAKLVKESSAGFKINIHELDPEQIKGLGRMFIFNAKPSIKRSGTGLVITVT